MHAVMLKHKSSKEPQEQYVICHIRSVKVDKDEDIDKPNNLGELVTRLMNLNLVAGEQITTADLIRRLNATPRRVYEVLNNLATIGVVDYKKHGITWFGKENVLPYIDSIKMENREQAISQLFISMVREQSYVTRDGFMELAKIRSIEVNQRRLYDLTIVLRAIGLIERKSKATWQWKE